MIILCALLTSNILISFDHLLSNLWQSLQLTSANLFPSALQLALYITFSLSIFMFPCFHSFQNLNFLLTLLLQSSLFGRTFCPSKSPTHSLFLPRGNKFLEKQLYTLGVKDLVCVYINLCYNFCKTLFAVVLVSGPPINTIVVNNDLNQSISWKTVLLGISINLLDNSLV